MEVSMVTYFYSGAVVSTMTDGARKERFVDGSITVEDDVSVNNVILKVKRIACKNDPRIVHIRQLNKI